MWLSIHLSLRVHVCVYMYICISILRNIYEYIHFLTHTHTIPPPRVPPRQLCVEHVIRHMDAVNAIPMLRFAEEANSHLIKEKALSIILNDFGVARLVWCGAVVHQAGVN
jgi:hypothetical protein